MIAVFFKNHKAEREVEDYMMSQAETALRDRMNHILREDRSLASEPTPVHVSVGPSLRKRNQRARQFAFQIDLA